MTAVNDEAVVPEFAHAVRGYDRYQVDDYIERLNEWASGAQARAVEAERMADEQAEEIRALRQRVAEAEDGQPPAPDQALKEAAERAAGTVAAAVRQADEIRRRASADAEGRLDEAGRQAIAVVEAARQSVAGLSEEAARERQESRLRVQARLDDAGAQAEQLRRRAGEDAEKFLGEARALAARLVAEAEQEASQIRDRTGAERRAAEEAVRRLQSERAEIVGELGRLRGAIQTLLSSTGRAPDAARALEDRAPDGRHSADAESGDEVTIVMEPPETEADPAGD